MMMMMRRSSGRGFGAKPGCNKKKGDREMEASSAGRKEEKEAQLHEYSCIPSYQNLSYCWAEWRDERWVK